MAAAASRRRWSTSHRVIGPLGLREESLSIVLIDAPDDLAVCMSDLVGGLASSRADPSVTHEAVVTTRPHGHDDPRQVMQITLNGEIVAYNLSSAAAVALLIDRLDYLSFDRQPGRLHIRACCAVAPNG